VSEGFDITLETVGGGAAAELFERELATVLQNIQDPNTTALTKRRIRLDFVVVPTEDRAQATVGVFASSTLAPIKPAVSTLYMGRRQGRLVAVGYDPRQTELFPDTTDEEPGVIPIGQRGDS
jgi:hypothetical protein